MKLALLTTLFATASAFTGPALLAQKQTSLKAFENEIGSQPPLGFWDPLGLLEDADQERFDRLRYVEIKHGRIAMLACAGHITVAYGARLGGDIDYHGHAFADIPNGWPALSAIPQEGLLQMIAFVGFLELFVMKDSANGAEPGEFVGDFRNGALDFGWDSLSAEDQERKRGIELNNGRAAQMGILALMVHEQLNGEPYVINGLLGASANP
ncbi:hypothetical protein TrLO_g6769 [Triparma laevis f. longispina]|uniref:Uncharacterized protein n=2 Tax=Triparma laevis TaxID=1534972 RepID=A0A9W7FDS7_9STRA|nr:hypothetical protein TrLO_g6769 [Triparma laevis f. longispina]